MPPRRRLTRSEQQAQTRARLLDAAVRVCAKRGLQEATLEQISEAAGYTAGAVYSNFKSKDDLLFAVFEERIEPRLQQATALMLAAETADEQADALGGLVRSLLGEDRAYLMLLVEFWGLAARNPKIGRRFAEIRRRRRAHVAAMITERVSRVPEPLEVDAGEVAEQFVALTIGVLFEGLVDAELDAERLHKRLYQLVARSATNASREASPRALAP
jgi:AcrR family transcriptional regulator